MNNIPEWAMKYKTRDVYIRNIGNKYYAYRTRSEWDKTEKRTKTLPPKYLGAVTIGAERICGICFQRIQERSRGRSFIPEG